MCNAISHKLTIAVQLSLSQIVIWRDRWAIMVVHTVVVVVILVVSSIYCQVHSNCNSHVV